MTQIWSTPPWGTLPLAPLADERFVTHKKELHQQLIASLNLSTIGTRNEDELRREIRWAAEKLCENRPNLLSHGRTRSARQRGSGRDLRAGAAGNPHARSDGLRHPDQRSQGDLCRKARLPGSPSRPLSMTKNI